MTRERRKHERHAIPADVRVTSGAQRVELRARNVSMGGVYVELEQGLEQGASPVPHGQTLELVVALSLEEHAAEGLEPVHCRGRAIRAGTTGIGIVFEEMDRENQERLRDLILRASRE